MAFKPRWTKQAAESFDVLRGAAQASLDNRRKNRNAKATKAEGLFKQVVKCIQLLLEDPRHPGLHTHEFSSIENPFDRKAKVFEAYVQNRTPGAYRLFWCYGPGKGEITLIAIAPHP